MTFANRQAFPNKEDIGLTKREYFAAHIEVTEYDLSYDTAKGLMNDSDAPSEKLANMKWWFTAKAKLKVMKADALIEALNCKTIK